MDKPKAKIKWLEKLKNIKHIEIYITIIFAIILILIFLSSTGSNKKATSYSQSKTSYTQDTTISSYTNDIENKLENILSQIEGASNVNVMITLDMEGTVIENNNIQTSTFPKVKGVVIVAKGVDNTLVKMNILKAVQAVIDISSGRIEILSSN